MLLDELHTAISPAVALPLIGGKVARQQAPAVAGIGVMRPPSALEQREAEIGVLDDGVARPAAGVGERRPAHEAHRAVGDDCIHLVPLHHAYVEETGIFPVHYRLRNAALAVAMVL